MLELLSETALALCRAEAAGVSVLDKGDAGDSVLRWCALAGRFTRLAADALPSDVEPCRRALERDEPVEVALGEGDRALVVPLPLGGGEAALWVVARGGPEPFTADDARRLQGLALVSGTAHRASASADALRRRELELRRLLDVLPVAAYTCDAEGFVTHFNAGACALWGREPEPGERFCGSLRLYTADGAPLAHDACWMARALAERRPFEGEAVIERPGGDRVTVLAHASPIRDENGAMLGAVNVMVDLTERLRAEEALRTSEQIYRAIGESIDYGVWVCDAEGRNVYASESFLRLVGLTQEQCSNAGWGSVLHPEEAERTLAAWRECVRTGGPWDVEHRFRGVDGKWHPVLARGVPVRNERGETTAWAGISLDISRQKAVEEELREAHRRKDEFLATLAHELRNPLAPIRSSLAVLRMADVDAEPRRLLEIVERQVEQLVRLVDDLLDVSRITRNKIELRRERVTLSAVLQAAIETSRPLIDRARHGLELSLHGAELAVDADPVRLAQAFTNLLDNAARFTEGGGRIAVRAWPDGEHAVVAVSDDGDGIPPVQLVHVFELYAQGAHTAGRAQDGLGIGLTLARRLVELHGGQLEARSDGPGHGSEFRVTLPLAAAPLQLTARASADPPPAACAARARVLVVDDNHDAADSLALLLRMLGAETQVAYDGAAALDALARFRAEIVLLDLGMPVMDGWEVARRIRERADGAPLLVALTGWGQPDDRRRTREAGFDEHLVKPVELAALRALVTRADAAGESA